MSKWTQQFKTVEVKDNKTKKIKKVKVGLPIQKDEVGNIYQKTGGVKPEACQKCKKKFDAKIESIPIKQPVPFYKCEDCKFENAGGDAALDHKIETDHKIKKISKDRLVGYDRKIIGLKSNIKKTKSDVKILCDDCK